VASKDLINLMTKLYQGRYNVFSINISSKRVGDSFTTVASVVLAKGEEKITLQSTEWDFIKYLVELRGVVDVDGEYRFKPVKNLEQYNADAEHLLDIDKSKLKNAADDLRSKKFEFTYNPPKIIDEFLKSERNVKNKKFLPLKRDYHYILAGAFLMSKEMLKLNKRLEDKYPDAKKIIDAADKVMKSFRPTGNPIKDYKFYRKYLTFDIDELGDRMSTQLRDADDIVKEFIRRSKVDANIAIPRMMNTYANFLEILSPMLNLLRIGLELRRGDNSPNKHCELVENIRIIKSDTEFGPLFGCLDEQIRHASAHASFRIDKAVRKVYLMDERGNKGKIVGTYTFDELTNMINLMNNQFFPVIYPTIALFDTETLDLLLVSREYQYRLLALGNC